MVLLLDLNACRERLLVVNSASSKVRPVWLQVHIVPATPQDEHDMAAPTVVCALPRNWSVHPDCWSRVVPKLQRAPIIHKMLLAWLENAAEKISPTLVEAR